MIRKKIFATALLVLIGIVFGVVLTSGFNLVKVGLGNVEIGASKPYVNIDQDYKKLSQAFIEVSKAIKPSIVAIDVAAKKSIDIPGHDFFKDFPFFFKDIPEEQIIQGSGSGVIISTDGYIVTNNHVVTDAKTVNVTLHDKRKFTAEVVGTDPLTDLAVVKIDAKDLQPAYLGNSDKVEVGEWVIAIGNPLNLTYTVTAGIISAYGRGIGIISQTDRYGIEDFIQTDAAINPGNSGGALVNLNGDVIGINTAIASKTGYYQGYGFAIPINIVKTVSKDLIEFGKVKRGYIGVQIESVSDATAKSLGMDKAKGVIVQALVEEGAAKDAGIEVGDVILSIDDREVSSPSDLQGYIATKHQGDKVKLKIYRDGKTFDKLITLKQRKEDKEVVETATKKKDRKVESTTEVKTYKEIGLSVKNMSNAELKNYKVENGILITAVEPASSSANAGLSKNLVISEVNKKKIDSVEEFDSFIQKNKGSAILLRVFDANGNSRITGIEIPK